MRRHTYLQRKIPDAVPSLFAPAPAQDATPLRSSVEEVLRTPGQPLDPATRAALEPKFGHDFSQVRIYANEQAAASANDFDALAYTVGPHIVFGAGQYNPRSPDGQRLLTHELTHVVQQAHGPVPGTPVEPGLQVSDPSDSAEQDATEQATTLDDPAPHPFGMRHPRIVGDREWGSDLAGMVDQFTIPPPRMVADLDGMVDLSTPPHPRLVGNPEWANDPTGEVEQLASPSARLAGEPAWTSDPVSTASFRSAAFASPPAPVVSNPTWTSNPVSMASLTPDPLGSAPAPGVGDAAGVSDMASTESFGSDAFGSPSARILGEPTWASDPPSAPNPFDSSSAPGLSDLAWADLPLDLAVQRMANNARGKRRSDPPKGFKEPPTTVPLDLVVQRMAKSNLDDSENKERLADSSPESDASENTTSRMETTETPHLEHIGCVSKYVELYNDVLMLKPEHRHGGIIRDKFYGKNFNSDVKERLKDLKEEPKDTSNTFLCRDIDGNWDEHSAKENDATLDHIIPVAKHWNTKGHNQTQSEREAWYNDTTNLQVVCKKHNSKKGSLGIKYQHNVTLEVQMRVDYTV